MKKITFYRRILGSVATKLIVSGATLAFVAFATPVFASGTEYQVNVYDSTAGLYTLVGIPSTSNGSYFTFNYKGTYPAQTTTLGGGSCSGTGCNINALLLNRQNPIGLEANFGSYGDGDYWFAVTVNSSPLCGGGPNTSPSCTYWYIKFVRSAGQWSSASSNTNTRILSVVSPLNASLIASTTVNFNFTYYNNSTIEPYYTEAGFELRNLTDGSQTSGTPVAISSSGTATYSSNLILTAGKSRIWRPYLYSASSTDFIYGDWNSFDVLTASASSTPYFNFDTASSTDSYLSAGCNSFGSSTEPIYSSSGFKYSICYAGGYLFVPSVNSVQQFSLIPYKLQTTFPFSYYYDVKSLITNSSTTANMFGTMIVNLPLVGTTTILSSDTINYFIGTSTASVIRSLVTYALYIGFAWTVWHRIRNLFKGKH